MTAIWRQVLEGFGLGDASLDDLPLTMEEKCLLENKAIEVQQLRADVAAAVESLPFDEEDLDWDLLRQVFQDQDWEAGETVETEMDDSEDMVEDQLHDFMYDSGVSWTKVQDALLQSWNDAMQSQSNQSIPSSELELVYGYSPMSDVLQLAVCKHCYRVIRLPLIGTHVKACLERSRTSPPGVVTPKKVLNNFLVEDFGPPLPPTPLALKNYLKPRYFCRPTPPSARITPRMKPRLLPPDAFRTRPPFRKQTVKPVISSSQLPAYALVDVQARDMRPPLQPQSVGLGFNAQSRQA